MSQFNKYQRATYKIKAIFVPSIIVWCGLIILFSLVYWLIFLKFGLFREKTELISVVMAFLLSGTAEIVWIVPRLKILNLNTQSRGSRNQLKSVYLIYLWLILTLPLIAITSLIPFLSGQTVSIPASTLSMPGLPLAGMIIWLIMVILPAFDQNELRKILDQRKVF